ncbi:hypothetical protein H0H93_011839 [Arthromyces matolae]|nr:hypothetical protein H0H93_011839 [Arthromyces matolae]
MKTTNQSSYTMRPDDSAVNSSRIRTFAVTIGINDYPTDPLHHAVHDADAFENFLMSTGVPTKNITSLRNKEATGMAILGALEALITNKDIGAQDNIIIFYAGHGSEANVPEEWRTRNRKMQMLIPCDFDLNLTTGPWNQPGHPILDIQLGDIIRRIHEKKGGLPITVVMDCCHSASVTRSVKSGSRVRALSMKRDYTIPPNALIGLGMTLLPPSRPTHILLAACAESQQAFERPDLGHGDFSYALLAVLNSANLKELTHSELSNQLAKYQFNVLQTPKIEGVYHDCIVFTHKRVPRSERTVYDIKPADDGFKLEVGYASGITKGAQFSIHTDSQCSLGSRVGWAIASTVKPFGTQLECSQLPGNYEKFLTPLPRDAPLYAVQILRGKPLELFIDEGDPHHAYWKAIIDDNRNDDISIRSISLVGPSQKADLAMTTSGEVVLFEVKHEICRDNGLKLLSYHNVLAGDKRFILEVLRSASNFFHHLDLDDGKDRHPDIDIECRRVDPCNGLWIPKPGFPNLNIKNKIYINFGDEVEDVEVTCGFEIKNKHPSLSYYAAVFMFDVHNLKITRYDLPIEQPTSTNDHSLPAGQSLQIGIGDSGFPARKYGLSSRQLESGQKTDIGFLKVFLSSKPSNFSHISQETPFQRVGMSRGDHGPSENDMQLFDTIAIPVIQGPAALLKTMGMPDF